MFLQVFRSESPKALAKQLREAIRSWNEHKAIFPEDEVHSAYTAKGGEYISQVGLTGHQALAAGAMGYLFKSVVEDELVDAIREVNAGRRYLPKGVAARLHEHKSGSHLTRREEEILDLLGKGLSNRELGQVLGVSEDTIKTHLKSLFRKLDVSDRAEAVREGLRRGFIHSQ